MALTCIPPLAVTDGWRTVQWIAEPATISSCVRPFVPCIPHRLDPYALSTRQRDATLGRCSGCRVPDRQAMLAPFRSPQSVLYFTLEYSTATFHRCRASLPRRESLRNRPFQHDSPAIDEQQPSPPFAHSAHHSESRLASGYFGSLPLSDWQSEWSNQKRDEMRQCLQRTSEANAKLSVQRM